MFKSSKSASDRHSAKSWRDYQAGLKRNLPNRPRRPFPWRRLKIGSLVAATIVVVTTLLWLGSAELIELLAHSTAPPPSANATPTPPAPAPDRTTCSVLDREQLRQLLDLRAFNNVTTRDLTLTLSGQPYRIETTLDPDLQRFLLNGIDRVNSRYVGIVALEAETGRVLALAGYDRTDPNANPCLTSDYPAASIFKIVTAATVVDHCGYSADSPVQYCGPKHTLYKRQLTDRVDRYTTTIPLREAFADSINPVFGKLGVLRLRKPQLEQAAATFGFNQPLDFDLPLPPSQFRISDEPYNWAEVASGFNLDTTLSPLHGAALATAVVNGGRMVTPTIIEKVVSERGEEVYRRVTDNDSRAIMSPRAAVALAQMMTTTIESGTARKTFRRYQRDSVLARLELGGKTGSIDSQDHELRFDWFVGFARERQNSRKIVVAAMVAHHKFIGVRAGEYARRAFTYYFSSPTERN